MKYHRIGNLKALAGILFVIACLAAASGCSTSKESYVAKGNKLVDAGKYAEAALNYRAAIAKDPSYGLAYYHLGRAEIKEQKLQEALDALYRANQLLPNNVGVQEQLGALSLQIYLLNPDRPQFYYNLVRQISDQLLKKNPRSFEGLKEKGYLAVTDGKRDESIALLRRALEVNPSDPGVSTALVQDLIITGQTQEAEKLGLDVLARHKSYSQIYTVLYQWYVKDNRPADAENLLKLKVSNNPREGNYFLELAAHYSRLQRPAEMQATLQRLLDNRKDFPQANLLVGDFYLTIRNYPEAIRYFEEGVRSSKDADRVLYQKRAAVALLAEGQGPQASSTVDQIVSENPKDKDARRVQANLLLDSGDPRKIQAAQFEFEELLKQDPNNAPLKYGLGRALELQGNLDGAKARYSDALKFNKNFLQARYALAKIALTQKQPDKALEQANEILKTRPDDPQARLLRAQALSRTGNWATARSELARINDFQHNVAAQVELGLLDLSEKKYKEAEEVFGKLRDSGDPQAIAGLARAYTFQKQFDKAVETLNNGLKKSPNSALLLSQVATTQALAGKYDASIATFQKAVALDPSAMQYRLDLADVFTLNGNDDQALATYRAAATLSPNDRNVSLALARALDRAGQVEPARAQYQSLLKSSPDDAMVLNDMAFFIWQHGGNLDQALEFAQRALKTAPGQPSFSDTMGCIYLKKGLRDSALQVFGNLVKKYPNYSTFRYHLGMALLENGDKKSAKKELETALTAHPSPQDEARIKQLLGKIS